VGKVMYSVKELLEEHEDRYYGRSDSSMADLVDMMGLSDSEEIDSSSSDSDNESISLDKEDYEFNEFMDLIDQIVKNTECSEDQKFYKFIQAELREIMSGNLIEILNTLNDTQNNLINTERKLEEIVNIKSPNLDLQIGLINIVSDGISVVLSEAKYYIQQNEANCAEGITLSEEISLKYNNLIKEINKFQENFKPSTQLEDMQVEKQTQEKELLTLEK
jgi:hypothetical protein